MGLRHAILLHNKHEFKLRERGTASVGGNDGQLMWIYVNALRSWWSLNHPEELVMMAELRGICDNLIKCTVCVCVCMYVCEWAFNPQGLQQSSVLVSEKKKKKRNKVRYCAVEQWISVQLLMRLDYPAVRGWWWTYILTEALLLNHKNSTSFVPPLIHFFVNSFRVSLLFLAFCLIKNIGWAVLLIFVFTLQKRVHQSICFLVQFACCD